MTIPYYVLDEDGTVVPKGNHIDVVSSVCPCAGLSSYHNKAGEDNPNNQWMEKSSEYILETIKPSVYWGENAPALAGKVGTFMKENFLILAKKMVIICQYILQKVYSMVVHNIEKELFISFGIKKSLIIKFQYLNIIINRDLLSKIL